MNTTAADRPAGKTILVTGGCGYVGSLLIRELTADEQLGNPVVRILDNMQGRHYQALMELGEDGRYEFIEGDILDPAVVKLALQGVDAVIHLAAIVRTPISFEHPSWVEQVNRWGTAHLVDACLEHGVQRFLYASSSAVYGPGGPFTERDPCRPIGPYAQSKKRAENEILAAEQRGLDPTILRLGTVFGQAPVLRFDAVVNRFAYLAGVQRPLTIYGKGDQKRPVVHVADASSAFRFCLANRDSTAGEVLNVVGENVSVQEVASAIQSLRPETPVRFTEQDVLTHLSFEASSDKMLARDWQPQYALADGIGELIARFRNLQRYSYQILDPENHV